jgi:glycosyltransferase involved in cell wall biosynthesis
MDHAAFGAILDRRKVHGQVSGIIFRPPNSFNHASPIARSLDSCRRWSTYLTAQRPALNRLFTLDECAASQGWVKKSGLLTFAPDPAPDLPFQSCTVAAAGSGGRRVFLLFGALTQRKGIFKMLDAIKHVPPDRQRTMTLRFVGRVDPSDAEAFHARAAETAGAYPEIRIEILDDFVSEDALAQEVVSCDVVLAPYQNHVGSSGVMFWASAAGKSLIAQKTGLMGYQVMRYGLGMTVDSTDPKAIAASLMSPPLPRRNKAFLQRHSPQAFTRAILDGVLGGCA